MNSMRWFLLAFLPVLWLAVACSDDNTPPSDGTGGSFGKGGNEDTGTGGTGGEFGPGEEEVKDTSGYTDRLTWSTGLRFGVHVWDLPGSETIFSLLSRSEDEAEEDEEEGFYGAPNLSVDGTTFAYTWIHSVFLTASRSEVRIVDLDSGDVIPYPTDDLAENEVRNAVLPSLSADGSRVAVGESTATLGEFDLPTDPSPLSIEVWDRKSNERIRVTDGPSVDTLPFLSADGSRVLFLSDRDEPNGWDFYMADVKENADVERLSFRNHGNIARLNFDLPEWLSVSADLRWVVFGANAVEGPAGFFLMDTTTGDIEQIEFAPIVAEPLGPDAVVIPESVAISGDGSRLAIALTYLDAESERMGGQVLTSPREERAFTLVRQSNLSMRPVALSADGSQIAYTEGLQNLYVDRLDGSDPRLVASEKDRSVLNMLGMHLSF